MGQANLPLFALAASGQHFRSREACHHLRYLCICNERNTMFFRARSKYQTYSDSPAQRQANRATRIVY